MQDSLKRMERFEPRLCPVVNLAFNSLNFIKNSGSNLKIFGVFFAKRDENELGLTNNSN